MSERPQERSRRPNVVLFISDQQRWDTIGWNGLAAARTPHLDRLANEGALFSRAFCATPMCSPARATILSGQLPHSHGVVSNHHGRPGCDRMHLGPEVKLLADYLGPTGYRTAYAGKWHLGTGADRRGFRDSVTRYGEGEGDLDDPNDNDYDRYAQRLGMQLGKKKMGNDPHPQHFDARLHRGPALFDLADHGALFTCNRAEHFIRRQADGEDDDPFLLVYSCIEPHIPWVSPEPFHSMYDGAQIDLPPSVRDDSGRWQLERACWQLASTAGLSEADLTRMWAAYLGSCSYVDYLAGRLLAALRDTGQLDDTLFIYTSDHGEMMGSHGLLQKGASHYEELMRIPLIVRPPGESLAAGGHEVGVGCDELVSHVDLVPTILDFCGGDANREAGAAGDGQLDGVSFRGLAEGGSGAVREAVVGEYHSSNWTDPMAPLRMWRTNDWKYVEALGADNELYNLAADPGECQNLAGDPGSARKQRQLAKALHESLEATGDSWPEVATPSAADMAARATAPTLQAGRR